MRSGVVQTPRLGLIATTNADGLADGSLIFDTNQRLNFSKQSKTVSLIQDEGFPAVNLTGMYWTNNINNTYTSDTNYAGDMRFYFPFYLPNNLTCDGLRTRVKGGNLAGAYSVAIYNSNADGLPHSRVLEHTGIAPATQGNKDLTFTQTTLKKGLYWIVFWRNANSFDMLTIDMFGSGLGILGYDFGVNSEAFTCLTESATYNTGSFPNTAPSFSLTDRAKQEPLLFGLRVA